MKQPIPAGEAILMAGAGAMGCALIAAEVWAWNHVVGAVLTQVCAWIVIYGHLRREGL